MPRRLLERVLPQRQVVLQRRFLRPFRALLHDPALWALHRRNVLRAMAVGIVSAFVPIPGQTALAGVLAIYFRVNIPVALLASMISNPLSMGPLYYGAYRLGLVVLGERSSVEAAPPLPDGAFREGSAWHLTASIPPGGAVQLALDFASPAPVSFGLLVQDEAGYSEAAAQAHAFLALPAAEQQAIVAFLRAQAIGGLVGEGR